MATPKEASTAKPKKEAAPPPSPRVAAPLSPAFMNVYRLVKLVALAAGFSATMLGLMASIGALTENGYARALGALVVTLAAPLVIGDRLLPKDDPTRAKGLITEVMAVTWTLFGFLFATVAHSATGKLLVNEGDRLQRGGFGTMARAAYFFGGVRPEIPPPAAAPDPSAAATGSAAATASATASADPSAAATASATASATAAASAAPSASAAPKGDKAEKTPAELFKELAPAVVTIFAHGQGDGSGTGFLLDKEGTIATNHHVINNATAVKIKMMNGAAYTSVELLSDAATVDLALLKIEIGKPSEGTIPEITAVTLGDSDAIVVGEHAVSIGNPLGLEHTLTDGLVSARRMYEGRAWIQMSVPVSPGNSGGPLFNMRGEVIGITTAQIGTGFMERAQNLNLAVPVNELKKLIKPEYPGKRKFGDVATKGQW